METNVMIVSPEPPPSSPHQVTGTSTSLTGGGSQCASNCQCLRSPLRSVVGATSPSSSSSTSGPSCLDCQQQMPHDQPHHYHEIGQTPLISATTNSQLPGRSPRITANQSHCDNPSSLVMHSNHPPCCCCCAGNINSNRGGVYQSQPQPQPHHRHQHSIPESDSGSQQGGGSRIPHRVCRIGPVLSSSTENLHSGCESQGGRRKKSTLRKKSATKCSNLPEDVVSLQSKSSRDVPTPSTANINDEMGSAKYSNQMEIYSEDVGNGTIKSDGGSDIEVVGPPLPPRLPMRPARITENVPPPSPGVRKYVLWCLLCGGAAGLLGIMFLGVYFLIRYYTSSVGYFETVPTFVPSTLLILTGLCIMSLARRRNRYTFLIKLSGACGLASALICALQTVTTTAVHMSRLQGLKECEYQTTTSKCICYTVRLNANSDISDQTARFTFDAIEDCGMVHGALYSCLRALFGLSVVGVLVAVISCMLVYQLLSHERKKMYWEQLELRCRSLYNGQPPHGLATIGQAGAPIVDPTRCRCCEQLHGHGMAAAYPWTEATGIRFWSGPAGNFYSPNPGGEEMRMAAAAAAMTGSGIRNAQTRIPGNGSGGGNNGGASTTGWSWPRMPWQRNETQRFRHPAAVTPSSPDSQYGFSNNNQGNMNQPNGGYSVIGNPPYGVWGPPPPYSDPNSPARRGRYQYIQSPGGGGGQCQQQLQHQQHQLQQSPPMIMTMHNDPNGMNMGGMSNNMRQSQLNVAVLECHHQQQQQQQQQQQHNHHQQHQHPSHHSHPFVHSQAVNPSQQIHQQCGGIGIGGGGNNGGQSSSTEGPHSLELMYPATQHQQLHPQHHHQNGVMGERRNFGSNKHFPNKDFYENSDCDGTAAINRGDTNSLPTRKTKKRVEAGAKSVGLNQPTHRVNVQDVFSANNVEGVQPQIQKLPALAQPRTTASGIEMGTQEMEVETPTTTAASTTFQSQTKETVSLLKNILEPAESEVYFGDVSSCCNVSVQQDNLYDETHNGREQQNQNQQQQQQQHRVACVSVLPEEDEEKDYLAQRFGNREASVRSRLPFPQSSVGGGGCTQEDMSRKLIPPMVQPRKSLLINKEPSRHSMCSLDSEADAKTEITDLSPNTPSMAMNLNEYHSNFDVHAGSGSGPGEWKQETVPTNFVASFPYSSTEQSQEAVRRPTPKVASELFSAQPHQQQQQQALDGSPQYEVIPEQHSNGGGGVHCPTTNAYLGHHVHNPGVAAVTNHHQHPQPQTGLKSPKSLKVTPIKRRNISADISTIIQNLNGSDVSLMYQDSRRESGPTSGDNFEYNSNVREDGRL